MPITSNLKPLVDSMVWEWCRTAPTATTAVSSLTTAGKGDHRYLYYSVASALYRYDTISDTWYQLSNYLSAPVNGIATQFKKYNGFQGMVISADTTSITAGIPFGSAAVGYNIRIISGTGAGQERTITAITDPTVADTLTASTITTSAITDSTKAWTINAYRGYLFRTIANTGIGQSRVILYNNATVLTWADTNYAHIWPSGPWGAILGTAGSTTAGSQTIGTIESSQIVVNTAWTVNPDATSVFMILSGSIFTLTSNASSPFATMLKYDVLGDFWQNKTFSSNLLGAQLGTDWCLERIDNFNGTFDTGTATSGTATTLVDTSKTWTTNRYAGYRVRITDATGSAKGQELTIYSNDATSLTVTRNWAANPAANETYEIIADNDKLYFQGHASAFLMQYSIEADMWSPCNILEWGATRNACVTTPSGRIFPVTSITRVGTTATVTTDMTHNLKAGETITVAGATGGDAATYNITTTVVSVTSTTVFTYTMGGTPSGSAAFTAFDTTSLLDLSKNWTVNQWQGKLVYIGNGNARIIASNTANKLVWSLALSGAVTNTTGKYCITETWALGTERTGTAGTTGYGTATAASTTTVLVDTSKTWPVSRFVGRRVRILTGPAGPNGGTNYAQEATITANDATSLTFAAITGTPTVNTAYSIYTIPGRAAAGQLCWMANNSNTATKGKYMFSIRGGGSTAIDRYDITTQSWTLLQYYAQSETFSSGTMCISDNGNRIYITKDATGRIYYYDTELNIMVPSGTIPLGMGSSVLGNRIEVVQSADGLKYLYIMRHSNVEMWRTLVFV